MMSRRVAVVFPGEPSDGNLSASVVPKHWLADPVVSDASACTGIDIARALSRRSVLGASVVQPAVVALALVAWRRLRARGITPTLVAGQAVGEVAAWAATGAIEPEDAHKLASLRGAAVQLASLMHPTTRRASPGNWNTIAMAPAREALTAAVAQVPRLRREIAQVSSLDGTVLADDDAPDLGAQLVEPASWRYVIATFFRFAITDVVVLPPSRMLRNLLQDAMGPAVRVHAIDDEASLERLPREPQEPQEQVNQGMGLRDRCLSTMR